MANDTYNNVNAFVDGARDGRRTDCTVIIAIPSHQKDLKSVVKDQDQWADSALTLFTELYKGATSFRAIAGGFRDDEGLFMRDEPILVESLATRCEVMDQDKLKALGEFAFRMGKKTKQHSVFVVIENTRHFLRI